jgi:hypothetical protein
MIAEIVSSGGGPVLAVVADVARRLPLEREGVRLTDELELAEEPGLARDFEHVVFVDPPAFEEIDQLAGLPTEEGGYLHHAWGEAEHRFALSVLGERYAQRPALVALYRDLRDVGEADGERLLEALRGAGRRQRCAVAAARGFRVLEEIGLVHGSPDGGDGTVGVVSSEGTDLERSAAFRAYSARYQEGLRYLERRRQP